MDNLAPIVLFVYNRPDHTARTIRALKENTLAKDSELYIYSDAAKNESMISSVERVRKLIYDVDGFKKVTVIKRDINVGLANSIIEGVSKIVKKYGKIIVLEDDLVTSPYFLTFMNDALCQYENEDKVWHISGWNYPIEIKKLPDTFLWRTMNCWGWATWSNRWDHFEKNTEKLVQDFSRRDVYEFNLFNSENFWGQVIANKKNKINTWAVFWYAAIFMNNGLCLNPSATYVLNIGLDGSGEHCGSRDVFATKINTKRIAISNLEICENKIALNRIVDFYKANQRSLLAKLINKLTMTVFKVKLLK